MRLDDDPDQCNPEDYIKPPSKTQKDLEVQLVLSLILGVSALIAFCVSWRIRPRCGSREADDGRVQILRPRWPSLYSARKRRLDQNIGLPALRSSFFGWIPGLYRITETQILASAGLDAFVVGVLAGDRRARADTDAPVLDVF